MIALEIDISLQLKLEEYVKKELLTGKINMA